ncbi:MAG: zinc dependent phospholipase C family protein [Firmicutes bacterium]|nr:zinc dependent phospholipase C family protein [Bacillota bacterium]
MKKKPIIQVLICVLLLGSFSSAYAVVGGEDFYHSTQLENDSLLQECLGEFKAELEHDNGASPQWGSGDKDENNPGTHGFIASQALTILENNNSTLDSFFTTARKKEIIKGSFQPDIDGAASLYKDHFYCEDGDGLFGYSLSAYDNFRNHYNGAVANYQAGNITEAMNRLGKALHFISDINEPHHSAGVSAINPTGNHTGYENWVESNYSSFKVSSMTTSDLTAYKNTSLLSIANSSAQHSRGYITQAMSTSVSNMRAATNATLPRAQRDAAGVMYKFAKEVGLI